MKLNVITVTYSQSVQFSSVTQSCPTLCNLMDCSTPGFPVHHQLPELAQTRVHRVDDAIQSSHPLPSPSLPPLMFPSIRVISNESALRISIWSYLQNLIIDCSKFIYFHSTLFLPLLQWPGYQRNI